MILSIEWGVIFFFFLPVAYDGEEDGFMLFRYKSNFIIYYFNFKLLKKRRSGKWMYRDILWMAIELFGNYMMKHWL